MEKKHIFVLILTGFFCLAWYQFVLAPMEAERLQKFKEAQEQAALSADIPTDTAPVVATREDAPKLPATSSLSPKTPETLKPDPQFDNLPESLVDVQTELFEAQFSSLGGRLISLCLKTYHVTPNKEDTAPYPIVQNASFASHTTPRSMAYELKRSDDGLSTTLRFYNSTEEKTYTFKNDSHFFGYQIKGADRESDLTLPAIANPNFHIQHLGFVSRYNDNSGSDNVVSEHPFDKAPKEAPLTFEQGGYLKYAGARNKYFLLLAAPTPESMLDSGAEAKENSFVKAGPAELYYRSTTATGGSEAVFGAAKSQASASYRIYAGPARTDVLTPDSDPSTHVFSPLLEFFGPDAICNVMLWFLAFFHNQLGLNMGLSILLLTLLVKALTFPLNKKSQVSMFKMNLLKPEVTALQQTYKNDRQQLYTKQQELWKKNGINPLSGCLPMLITMPVFICLFSTVGQAFMLRQAPFFGWIQDLSAPDRFFVIKGFSLPLIGEWLQHDGNTNINIMVLFYVISLMIQQSLMPQNDDPQQQQTQKMMKFMMFGFAILLYNYSSGLMLYFVFNNLLSIAESLYIRKKLLPSLSSKKA